MPSNILTSCLMSLMYRLISRTIPCMLPSQQVCTCSSTDSLGHALNCPLHQNSHAFVVDDAVGYVIVHPDRLISPSRITESFDCQRKAVLGEYFNSVGTPRIAPLLGTLLHEVFDHVLQTRLATDNALISASERAISKYLSDILLVNGETETTVLDQMKSYFPMLRAWMDVFLPADPQANANRFVDRSVSFSPTGDVHDRASTRAVTVHDVVDIEDTVWSPRFGLTGKVDATVRLCVAHGTPPRQNAPTAPAARTLAPLELKTGKRSGMALLSHRAQVLLYVLMLQDKHRSRVDAGLLLYLKTGECLGVAADRNDTRALLMARNHVAAFLHGPGRGSRRHLPPMLQNARQCARCFQVSNCMLAHAAVEAGSAETSGVGDEFTRRVHALTTAHRTYFRAWYDMVLLEYGHGAAQAELWSMAGHDREQRTGLCLGALCVVHAGHAPARDPAPPHPRRDSAYVYRFARASHCGAEPTGVVDTADAVSPVRDVSLQARKLWHGSRVVVSTNDGQTVALGMGTVASITPDAVEIHCPTPVASIPLAPQTDGATVANRTVRAVTNTVFRLDVDPKSFGLKMAMSNLAALFTPAEEASPHGNDEPVVQRMESHRRRLRELIVDLKAPSATAHPTLTDAARLVLQQLSLNACQQAAIHHALRAQDYALILGMPGTGKTTTIASLIHVLLAQGLRVLVTSYTHTAVDNILLKLQAMSIAFLRVGNPESVAPALRSYTLAAATAHATTVAELEAVHGRARVVGVTCLGVHHALFRTQHFDVCIVDEASQITQPVCLGPVLCADRFVLVGDHYQLQPLVQHAKAAARGMGVSLFTRLCEAHPAAAAALDHQYRMNACIMQLPNALIYRQRLKCGTSAVADARLCVRDERLRAMGVGGVDGTQRHAAPPDRWWLCDVVDPARPVVFLDTSSTSIDTPPGLTVPAADRAGIDSTSTDARVVAAVCSALVTDCGLDESTIGVISPYRAQLVAIRHAFAGQFNDVDVDTVDRYQGRDKDCIVIALAGGGASGEGLLHDWRRVNVAITRARCKLIFVGSVAHLRSHHLVAQLLDILRPRSWITAVPRCNA
eukprot:m.144256 g.144256  ORF g.144256 m.144256 type:complete len:1074 (-) comp17709_c0_seq2:82-3303(-)